MSQLSIFDRYPSSPGSKVSGTSAEAAQSMEPKAKLLRDKCLQVLRRGPKTADEVASYLGETVLSIRPRISELSAKTLIEETGERRQNESGKWAAVYRVKI